MTTISDDEEARPLLGNKEDFVIEGGANSNWINENTSSPSSPSTSNAIGGFLFSLFAAALFVINGILVQYFSLSSVDTVIVRSLLQIVLLGVLIKIKG